MDDASRVRLLIPEKQNQILVKDTHRPFSNASNNIIQHIDQTAAREANRLSSSKFEPRDESCL